VSNMYFRMASSLSIRSEPAFPRLAAQPQILKLMVAIPAGPQ
jgi:hypothetical protein